MTTPLPDPKDKKHRRRRFFAFAAKSLFSFGLILFLFWQFPIEETFRKAQESIHVLITIPVLLAWLKLLLSAYRWKLVIAVTGPAMTYLTAAKLTLIGHFFNQVLPTSVGGDVVKSWGAHKDGLKMSHAVTSIILDRMIGFTALIFIILIGLPLLASMTDDANIILFSSLFSAAGFIGGTLLFVFDHILRFLPEHKFFNHLADFSIRSRRLFQTPMITIFNFLVSVFCYAVYFYSSTIVARGLGVDLSFWDAFLIFPGILLISSLPISIAGWGVREVSLVGAFAILGHPADVAVTTSILLGASQLIAGIPGGAFWAMYRTPRKTVAG